MSKIRASRRSAAVAGTGLAAVLMIAGAAQAGAQTVPVTAYTDYPPALPSSCPDGASALVDAQWTSDAGETSNDLASMDLHAGETVTASWSAFAPGCAAADGSPAITVSFAAYDGGAYPFDATVDQQLVDGWSSCGAGSDACAQQDGRYVLRLTLPTADLACVVQLDTVLGAPLDVVGPSGSFYSPSLREDNGPNMLVGSNHESVPCMTPTTVASSPVSPSTTAASQVSPSSVVASPTTTAGAAVLAASVTAPASQLPFTGANSMPLLMVGGSALVLGLGLTAASRRRTV